MIKKIAYIHWGYSSQLRSFEDFSYFLDECIYIGDLDKYDLNEFSAVIVADGLGGELVFENAEPLNAYVKNGGFLIVFFQGNASWIDVVDLKWLPITTGDDWLWWTKPNGRLKIHQTKPKHSICEYISLEDMSWHWGGVYAHHEKAKSILELDSRQGSLFLDFDKLKGGGRLMVSTLDPHFHNGQRFMPATTRFLQSFYPWLNKELAIKRPKKNRFCFLTPKDMLCAASPSKGKSPTKISIKNELVETNFKQAGFDIEFCVLYELDNLLLENTDILYILAYDDIFLKRKQDILLNFLSKGGNLFICGETAIPWLPFLSPFNAIPTRPFTNMQIRLRDDRVGFFKNMNENFNSTKEGIFGGLARGWSDMPKGAFWLTEIGAPNDPKPCDWLWRYPSDNGRGGFVFMHNGNDMIRCTYGDNKLLICDIALRLQELSTGKQIL